MKRLLLDTQVLLWWLADDPRLPAWAIAAVQAPGAEVFVSQVSLWELALKQRQGRVQLDLARLEQEVTRQHFHWLPLRNEHLLALAQLDSSAAPSTVMAGPLAAVMAGQAPLAPAPAPWPRRSAGQRQR